VSPLPAVLSTGVPDPWWARMCRWSCTASLVCKRVPPPAGSTTV